MKIVKPNLDAGAPSYSPGGRELSNLGGYQVVVTVIKKLGGPRSAAIIVIGGSFAVGRGLESGIKKAFKASKAAIKKRNTPCATKGQLFKVVSDGEASSGLKLRAGDEYRVLECDGDSILIGVLDDPDNPYFVSSEFLTTVSDFPAEDAAQDE